MRPDEAVFLRNWFPRQSFCVTRPGFSLHCNVGTNAAISCLIPFENQTSTKLLAASSGGIYDATTSSPSTLATGFSNDNWSYAYLSNVALLANGADAVRTYNGTAIASPTFTGVTLTTLEHVSVYKSRAYFVERNSQRMWYGGVAAIAGALTAFDFSTVASIEGNLVFTASLKGDGGTGGQDDVFVAVFEGGDALAYVGSNPGDPTDWALIGHYKIGRPLGRLAYTAADDDIYVVTDRGYERLSEVTKYGRSLPEQRLLSNRIQGAVADIIKSSGASLSWRVCLYQRGQMLLVLAPSSGARRHHVQNINTGAWCEFRGIDASSWGVLNGDAYFGHISDGRIYAFDDGSPTDNGVAIRCDAQQAWTDMGYGSLNKEIKAVRPFIFGAYQPAMSVNVGSNYNEIPLAQFSTAEASSTLTWDSFDWDTVSWANENEEQSQWFGRNAFGSVIGARVTVDINSTGGAIEWNSTQVLFAIGGYL